VGAARRPPTDDRGAGGAPAVPTDLRDPAAVERLVAAAAELGGPDLLVHAAGVGTFAPIGESRVDEWDEMLDVNLRAACRRARSSASRSWPGSSSSTPGDRRFMSG
jgi:NAD(P)-dependent dehydrogenase (short-subunit alcohol dehydrogenase family)